MHAEEIVGEHELHVARGKIVAYLESVIIIGQLGLNCYQSSSAHLSAFRDLLSKRGGVGELR
jgi:hypothetical protein